MLKAHSKPIRFMVFLVDAAIFLTASASAYQYSDLIGKGSSLPSLLLINLFALLTWCLLLNHFNLYGSFRRRSRSDLFLSIAMVHLLIGTVLFLGFLIFAPQFVMDGTIVVFLLVSFVLVSIDRILVRIILGYFRSFGFNTRNAIVVGLPENAKNIAEKIALHSDWGLIVLGTVTTCDEMKTGTAAYGKMLGHARNLTTICRDYPVDEVLLCDSIEQFPELNLLAEELRELGVSTRLVLEKFDDRYTSREVNFFCNEIPFLTLSTNKFDSQWIIFKRALDIFGALIGLLLLVLFFPFLAIAIKLESPGPIFFIQRRVGENGRLFNLWKFRSMDTDAEERKKELLAQNEMNGAIFKIRRDPRVTRVGEFLRRTSLDEFPQFFNVLRGDMSLVGTRPPTPDEVANYENWQLRRISIKPGLTGLWQVSGRNKVKDFNDIVKIDLAYIDNWTPLLDIKILFKTVPVVISKDGSC